MKGVETRLSAPLAAMALLTVFVLVAVLFMIAARVDGDALRHEQALVQRGIDSKIADLQRIVSPQVLWDEAVEHLDNRFDANWAADNISTYLVGQGGFDMIFVVDHEDRPVFNALVAKPATAADYVRGAASFKPLIAKVRDLEARRPRVTGPRADGGLVSRPAQVSAIEAIDGEMSTAERDAAISGLASGRLQVITSCDLISEGFDCPSIAAAISAPTVWRIAASSAFRRSIRLART